MALGCGAEILDFSIIGAHVTSAGGTYNAFTSCLLNAAGVGFPILVSVTYMLFLFRPKCKKTWYRVFSFLFSVVPCYSLLAWIFIPFT